MSYFFGFILSMFGIAVAMPVALALFLLTVFILGCIAYGAFLLAARIYSKFL